MHFLKNDLQLENKNIKKNRYIQVDNYSSASIESFLPSRTQNLYDVTIPTGKKSSVLFF